MAAENTNGLWTILTPASLRIYIGAVFLTYLALGVGLLKAADLFTSQHAPARIGALIAILIGLWMVKDYFLPDWGPRLQAPGKVADFARQAARKATVPALVTGGFLYRPLHRTL